MKTLNIFILVFILLLGYFMWQANTVFAQDDFCCWLNEEGVALCNYAPDVGNCPDSQNICVGTFNTCIEQEQGRNTQQSNVTCCCLATDAGTTLCTLVGPGRQIADESQCGADRAIFHGSTENECSANATRALNVENVPTREGSPSVSTTTNLVNPLTGELGPVDLNSLFVNIIRAFLGIAGALALVFTIFGGVKWMTSGGNPEKIQSGRDTLLWAVLGLAVILLSYVILNFAVGLLNIPIAPT